MRRITRILSLLLAVCLLGLLPTYACADGDGAAEPDRDETPLPEEWFDGALFVGDSIAFVLQQQCEIYGQLEGMLIWSERSLNVRTVAWGALPLWYQGREYSLPELVGASGADKLFLCLGVNDINQDGGIELTMELWQQVCDAIVEAAPDVQLFFQSCFPMWSASEYDRLTNALIDEYNERLRAFCEENGFVFVDLADYFRGEDGGVAEEFTSDHYVHINMAAAPVWVEQLRNPLNYSVDPRSF